MTYRCYLLGEPNALRHSLSPVMHNAAFKALGLDYVYETLEAENLAEAADQLRGVDVKGGNVTMPYKMDIIKHLNSLSPEAARTGAVNTILSTNGRLEGFNTDGPGALKAIREAYGNLTDANVLLLGAGGAAKAIAHSLVKEVGRLVILNRNLEKAASLAQELDDGGGAEVVGQLLNEVNIRSQLEEADVLINATPVGMYPNTGDTLAMRESLNPRTLVFDIVYKPLKTRLIREAEEAGCRTLTGEVMLVYQGALSFQIWTGIEPPIGLMHRAVLDGVMAKG